MKELFGDVNLIFMMAERVRCLELRWLAVDARDLEWRFPQNDENIANSKSDAFDLCMVIKAVSFFLSPDHLDTFPCICKSIRSFHACHCLLRVIQQHKSSCFLQFPYIQTLTLFNANPTSGTASTAKKKRKNLYSFHCASMINKVEADCSRASFKLIVNL